MRRQFRSKHAFGKGLRRCNPLRQPSPGRRVDRHDHGGAPLDHRIRRTEFFHYPTGGRR